MVEECKRTKKEKEERERKGMDVERRGKRKGSPVERERNNNKRKMSAKEPPKQSNEDDDKRRDKVKQSEQKRRDRLRYWFEELQRLLMPPPENATEQDKLAYARKKRDYRKEDILEMATQYLVDQKSKLRALRLIIAKLTYENQQSFNALTQEEINVVFDIIYTHMKEIGDITISRNLLNALYALAKKSTIPQHELTVCELASRIGLSDLLSEHEQSTTSTLLQGSTPSTPSQVHSPFSDSDAMISSPIPPSISPVEGPTEHARYDYPDGSIYEGEWRGGMAHGRGRLIYATGDRYEGEFVATRKQGHGEFVYSCGHVYNGQWLNDKANGAGELRYSNGDRYVGNWKDDKRHGHGIFLAASGNRYEGQWVNGRKEGKGTLFFPNGNRYDAMWSKGLAVSGVLTFSEESPWSNPDY